MSWVAVGTAAVGVVGAVASQPKGGGAAGSVIVPQTTSGTGDFTVTAKEPDNTKTIAVAGVALVLGGGVILWLRKNQK